VELAGLQPSDVRVEAVVGRVGSEGELTEMQVLSLPPLEQNGTKVLFGREFMPLSTGRLGCSVRVSPNHFDDPLNRPCNAPIKWAGETDGWL
jgi:starch phosphorylase